MPIDEPRQQYERELAVRIIRLAVAVGVLGLLLAVLSPFFSIIAWSAVLCYALYPLHRHMVRALGGHRTLSALVMCLIITIGVILPVTALSIMIGEEVTRTYTTVTKMTQEGGLFHDGWRELPLVSTAIDRLHAYERLTGRNLRAAFADNLNDIGKLAVQKLMHAATNVLMGIFELGFILLVSFFFFRDGEVLVSWLRELVPFSHERQELVLQRFDDIVIGSIYGNALIALMVGVVGGVAFFAAGLHSPVLWGTVMGILAYLPIAGAALVWVPGALYLFVQSAYIPMGIVCLAGAVIFVIDHVVRNVLVANRVQLHPLLVLFSVFGGIQLLGLLGLVAGPLIVAVGRTILDVYRMEKGRQTSVAPGP